MISRSSKQFLGQVLTACRVDPFNEVYVLGSFDLRKTLDTQQRRAAAMGMALTLQTRRPRRVAVVGGGVAGITIAAFLLTHGVDVTLFERSGRLLNLQKDCYHRFLHPSVYSWPTVARPSPNFSVAGISWTADYADNVAHEIERSFGRVRSGAGAGAIFTPQIDCSIEHVDREVRAGARESYFLQDTHQHIYAGFDAVILAVGFGIEHRAPLGVRTPPYWERTPYEFKDATETNPHQVLVSGTGDGGLIDVLTAALRAFQPSQLIDLLPRFQDTDFIKLARVTERKISEAIMARAPARIMSIYDATFKDDPAVLQIAELADRTRSVTLNSRSLGFFEHGSSALNRMAVYLLVRAGVVRTRFSPLSNEMVADQSSQEPPQTVVHWPSDGPVAYRHVVMRHGVKSGHFERTFPALALQTADLGGRIARLNIVGALPADVAAAVGLKT